MSVTPVDERLIAPARRVRGRLSVPGDKSISHRYAVLAALAEGRTRIANYAPGADCLATLEALRALGVSVTTLDAADASGAAAGERPNVEVLGRGLRGLEASAAPLDVRNSGTTMRLLAGVMAAHPFQSVLTGDESLRRRPMQRVIGPLERMGARISSQRGKPPLVVRGANLTGIDYRAVVPSAQVKSAILLAGLQAEGTTRVAETVATRDHTELALLAFGAAVDRRPDGVEVRGGEPFAGQELQVPGDISSAAFLAAAAAALEGSELEITGVGLNPTRRSILPVLERFGAHIETWTTGTVGGEPIGSIRVGHGGYRTLVVGPDEVPALIDELPVLAALATHGGELTVTGAGELRFKESDRITGLVTGLRALGADAEELPDGFHVRGRGRLAGGAADAQGDHRLAMAFAVAALGAAKPSIISGAESVAVSYPGFFEVLESLCE